jgi:hypothetical protein
MKLRRRQMLVGATAGLAAVATAPPITTRREILTGRHQTAAPDP